MLIAVQMLSSLVGSSRIPVLHVGAHAAEESQAYRAHGWGPCLWVEALPDMADSLRRRFEGGTDDAVLEGAAWSTSGLQLMLNRASNGESSSLLEPTGHLESHPGIAFPERVPVSTVTLDQAVELMQERFGLGPTFLNLDIQGAELEAMRGLTDWGSVSWVYTEVSVRELYAGQALIGDIDGFLVARGFRRVATVVNPHLGWGDALYARSDAWRVLPLLGRLVFSARVGTMQFRIRASLARSALRHRLTHA